MGVVGGVEEEVARHPQGLGEREEEHREDHIRDDSDREQREPLDFGGGNEDAGDEQDSEQQFGRRGVDDYGGNPVALFTREHMPAVRALLGQPVVTAEDSVLSAARTPTAQRSTEQASERSTRLSLCVPSD